MVVKTKYRGTPLYYQAMAELIHAAQHGGVTTYQDIPVIMGLPVEGNDMGIKTGHILGEISEDEVEARRPMLSSVEVNTKGIPGPGYFYTC